MFGVAQQVGNFRNRAPSSSRWPINSSWPSTAPTHSIVLTKKNGGGIGAGCPGPGVVGAVGAVVGAVGAVGINRSGK